MNNYTVYKLVSPSGKIYVGITRQNPEKRWKNGRGYANNPHLIAAIERYGWENFSREILFSNLTRENAGELEKQMIQIHKSYDPQFGYNVTFGGEFGVKFTQKTKDKLSQKQREHYSDPSNRKRQRETRLGKTQSESARLKMSLAKTGKPHPISEETRHKMQKGILLSNVRLRENDPERYKQLAHIRAERGRMQSKSVVQFTKDGSFVKTYPSTHAAERETKIRNGNISSCCNKHRKTAGGFIWVWESETKRAPQSQ